MKLLIRLLGGIIRFGNNVTQNIKKFYETQYGKAIILNAFVFVILNAIAYATWCNDIDIMLQVAATNAASGYSTSHVGFINVLLMKLIRDLMIACPAVPWYTWIIVMTSFVALSILGFLILDNHSGKSHVVLLFVFYLFFGYECYMFPSYIKSAYILCFSLVLMCYYLFVNMRKSFIGIVLLLIGLTYCSLLSYTGFWIGLISGIVVVFALMIIRREHILLLARPILILVVAIIAACALRYVDCRFYINGPKGELVTLECRNAIEKLETFGYPEYEEEFLTELNISSDVYERMKKDGEYFVEEVNGNTVYTINRLSKETIDLSPDNILKYFRTVPIRQIKVGYFYLSIILGFMLMNSLTKNKKNILIILAVALLIAGLFAYIYNAWDSKMTQMIVYLPVSFIMLATMKKITEVSRKELVVGLIVIGVILYNNFSAEIVTSVKDKHEMSENMDDMVVYPTYALNLNSQLKQYSAYAIYPTDMLFGVDYLITNGSYFIYPNMSDHIYEFNEGKILMYSSDLQIDPNWFVIIK